MELPLGFEPRINGVADRAVKPLRYSSMVPSHGVGPRFTHYHCVVLPMNDKGISFHIIIIPYFFVSYNIFYVIKNKNATVYRL